MPLEPTKKTALFGYDFFNNQNISFQPNLNLATPANYQLGPGDALVISLWGAAENTYNLEVNRNGAIKIPNVGLVTISGMSLDVAKSKIESSLLKVYRGISAPDKSPIQDFYRYFFIRRSYSSGQYNRRSKSTWKRIL